MVYIPHCRSHCQILPTKRYLSSLNYARTHYEVLDVPRNAHKKDIKSAFLKLSKKHHPDVSADKNSATFIDITEAYTTLIDPARRTSYDHELKIIETYMNRTGNSQYSGSHGYAGGRPFTDSTSYHSDYHSDYSKTDFGVIYEPRRNHGRVVGYLIVLLVVATCLHTFRIHWTHKEFQRISELESNKNYLIYNNVRETAKSSTLEEQLQTLSKKHLEGLNKFKSER